MIDAVPSCRHRERCALCGSRELATVLSLSPTPPGNARALAAGTLHTAFPLDLGRCGACGHVQLLDIVDRITVLGRPAAADRVSLQRSATAQALARALAERLRPAHDQLIIDVGSNDGTFLKVFDDLGMRVQGIEPAANLAGEAIGGGVPTHAGLFSPAIADRIEEMRGRAAIVIGHQAFAEAEDPFAFMEGVRTLLRRDGVFAFSVEALDAIIAGGRIDRIHHRALSYHTVAPLKRFLAACDLDLFAAARVGARLDGLAQRLGGTHAADGSVEALIAIEAAAGFGDGSALAAFAARVPHLVAMTAAELARARDAGARIVAVGAGCGAATWLGQLSEAAAALAFLADGAPERQGRFSPVLDLPIRPLDDLAAAHPDLVLILDPDQEAEVHARLAAAAQGGVRIVKPSALAAAGAHP